MIRNRKKKSCSICSFEGYFIGKKCNACSVKKYRSGYSKRKKATGELDLFVEIWNERPHISEVSGKPIKYFNVGCFSHILPKGQFKRFRLKKENIVLKTLEEHFDWTFNKHELKDREEWKKIFELETELKKLYNGEI